MTTHEPIWFTTGNPFVDMGQEMMAALADVSQVSELTLDTAEKLLPNLVSLYIQEDWKTNLTFIFPNSKLINPSIKNPQKEYATLLNEWLNLLKANNKFVGICAISGQNAHVFVSKTYLPMTDGTNSNFHSANSHGVPLSASVAIALQFMPLALLRVGGRFGLPQFSNDDLQFEWGKRCHKNYLFNQTIGKGGMEKTPTSKSANAFFYAVESLVRLMNTAYDKAGSVSFYLFNNDNRSSIERLKITEIHYMPASLFKFIRLAMTPDVFKEWQIIVRRGYINAKDDVDAEKILNYPNQVYERLLANQSISGFFIARRERRPTVQGQAGWLLFSTYLKEVCSMEQRRLESLKNLGDRIAPIIRDKRKRLLRLERVKSKGEFTGILYSLTKDAAARGQDKPLITFEQLVQDVFPQDIAYSDWREVQYLLLFRIYEQLFDDLKDDPSYLEEEPEENNDE